MTHFAIPDLEAENREEETRLLKCENDVLHAKVARLEAAGDKLTQNWKVSDGDSGYNYCIHCNATDFLKTGEAITHFPDCPVTLWNEAKAGKV